MKKNLLPKVFPVGTKLGKLNETVAAELGLDKNTIIYAGTTDSNAGFLSCTNFEKGSAVSSLGSTLAIKVLSENQIETQNQQLRNQLLRDQLLNKIYQYVSINYFRSYYIQLQQNKINQSKRIENSKPN